MPLTNGASSSGVQRHSEIPVVSTTNNRLEGRTSDSRVVSAQALVDQFRRKTTVALTDNRENPEGPAVGPPTRVALGEQRPIGQAKPVAISPGSVSQSMVRSDIHRQDSASSAAPLTNMVGTMARTKQGAQALLDRVRQGALPLQVGGESTLALPPQGVPRELFPQGGARASTGGLVPPSALLGVGRGAGGPVPPSLPLPPGQSRELVASNRQGPYGGSGGRAATPPAGSPVAQVARVAQPDSRLCP